jgi:hypothetical protein
VILLLVLAGFTPGIIKKLDKNNSIVYIWYWKPFPIRSNKCPEANVENRGGGMGSLGVAGIGLL